MLTASCRILLCIILILPALLHAQEDDARGSFSQELYEVKQGPFTPLILEARESFDKFRYGRGTKSVTPFIPDAELKRAKCIAIFPRVQRAAMLVGAKHGEGVASCKSADDRWSQLGFLDLTGGSFGLQAGATTTEAVMLFQTDKAVQNLKSGKLELERDLNVIMGYKSESELNDAADPDIVIYTSQKGIYGGAKVQGTLINADRNKLREFYKEETELSTVLSRFETGAQSVTVQEFLALLQHG